MKWAFEPYGVRGFAKIVIEVRCDGHRVAHLVMTRAEWDDFSDKVLVIATNVEIKEVEGE